MEIELNRRIDFFSFAKIKLKLVSIVESMTKADFYSVLRDNVARWWDKSFLSRNSISFFRSREKLLSIIQEIEIYGISARKNLHP